MEKENKQKSRKELYIAISLVVAGILILVFVMSTTGMFTGRVIDENSGMKEFNDCLADNGMIIYGSHTCPACSQLVERMGGYDAVESVYVECMDERQKCSEEAKTGYVPEIQIDGEVYEGSRTIEAFAEETGCEVPK